MADRPILFSAPMIRALIAGTKTQTRRALKFQPAAGISIIRKTIRPIDAEPYHSFERRSVYGNYAGELDIKIKRGDRLWVREAWRCNGWATDVATIFYAASESDGYTTMCEQYPIAEKRPLRITAGWRPSIHMPRWASRLTLTVTEVRVEQLQDITNEDCIAEGVPVHPNENASRVGPTRDDFDRKHGLISHYGAEYKRIWDSINGAGAWDTNPWVVAYTFKVQHGNIDQIAQVAA